MASDINLVFLGSGDAVPSVTRNHSSIFLNYKDENILFDCGEGTQRQIRKAGLNPCKINKIFISHWHGDHVLGIPGLLQTLALSGYPKDLTLYGPRGTKKFIDKMFETFLFVLKFPFRVVEISEGEVFDGGEYYIEAKEMSHGISCMAYNFVVRESLRIDSKKMEKSKLKSGPHMRDLKDGKDIVVDGKKYKAKDFTYLEKGKKISIVMDTKNNPKIIPFVKEADVLIIESSFAEDMEDKAKEYNHMTSKQCGEIAKKGKVGKLYLTHISSRYKNQKIILEEAKKEFKNSELAKDLMKLKL